MKRPKMISFDVAHTISFPRHDVFICLAEEHFGQRFTAAQIKEADYRVRYMNVDQIAKTLQGLLLPDITTIYSCGLICELMPRCLDDMPTLINFLKACKPVQDDWFKTLGPETIPCLEMLKAKGFRLGVISNANGKVKVNLADTGADKYFDVVADSGQVGFEKPDPRIFQYVFELARIRPDELLHIGDSMQADVCGAMNAGAQAALFDPDFRVPPGSLPPHVPHYRSLLHFAASFCPAK